MWRWPQVVWPELTQMHAAQHSVPALATACGVGWLAVTGEKAPCVPGLTHKQPDVGQHVLAPPLARKGSSPGPRGRGEPRWLCWALGHPQLDMCTLTPCGPHAKVASPTQTPMLAAPNLPAHQLPGSFTNHSTSSDPDF